METILLSLFFIIAVAIHLGMVFCVIWTIISPELGSSKKKTSDTTKQKQGNSTTIYAQNRRRPMQSGQQHIHGTFDQANRMARDAHDTAVRDAWMLHEDANHMAQHAHDNAVFDHQVAVEIHDNFASDPGFGCGPFF